MNPHESAALVDALEAETWVRGEPRSDALGRMGYSITTWTSHSQALELDHVDLDNSGNLIAGILATKHFTASSASYDMIIMFGCAGLNPLRSTSQGLRIGSIVLVDHAQYAENGRVLVQDFPSQPNRVERVLIKGDRLRTFTVELSSGLTDLLSTSLSLPKTRALCVDKVLEVDPQNGPTQPPQFQEYGYTDLVKGGRYDIIDMESFGFLWALGDLTRSTAVIRVLTDDLKSHAGSTASGGGLPSQSGLLRDAAPIVLRALETHPRITQVEPASASQQDRFEAAISVLYDAVSLSALSSETPTTAVRQFLKWISLVQPTSDMATNTRDRAFAEWLESVDTSSDLGYGTSALRGRTHEVAPYADELLREMVAEREDRISQRVEVDDGLLPGRDNLVAPLRLSDYKTHVARFFDRLAIYLDPTSSRSAYHKALKAAVRALGAETRVAVRPDPRAGKRPAAQIAAQFQRGPTLRVSPDPMDEKSGSDESLAWRGWEDDGQLQTALLRYLARLG